MNGNIIRVFELTLAIFVFILAISLTTTMHDQLNYVLTQMESASEGEMLAYRSKVKGMDLTSQKEHSFDEKAVRRLIADEIILLHKSETVDSVYSKTEDRPEFPKIRLDFMNGYLHDSESIPQIPEGLYDIVYISDSDENIVEIRVTKK